MDIDSNLGETSQSSTCALCRSILPSENDDFEAFIVCGDCRFRFLEDYDTTSPDVYPRRRLSPISRPRRHDSSESMESMFSHHFSQIITSARQNASNAFDRDYSVDGDDGAMLGRRVSSRTTPSGSRRWRRVFSDSESEGFDSVFGGSESRYGAADTASYSVYGGESVASVDGHSYLENDTFGNPNGESDLDSDDDIDPMNAGIFHWNSEEDEDEGEWDEAELESFTAAAQPHLSNGGDVFINWRRPLLSPEVVTTFSPGSLERIRAHTSDLFSSVGDHIDSIGFDDFLEHLAENESSRRGAPPASVSFIKNMPSLPISEDKVDGMACAVCKDSFTVGTIVNQLPCFHMYHPSCILPWLNARNTCPVCRYELPTDDRDYEARKRNEMHIIHQHDLVDDSSLVATDDVVDDEPSPAHRGGEGRDHDLIDDNSFLLDATYDVGVDEPFRDHHASEQREPVDADSDRGNDGRESGIPRNRWLFLATPIVSIVGISLILLLGNPDRICPSDRIPCRRENNQRRWWSFF